MISLQGKPGSVQTVEQNGRSVRVEYDARGNLSAIRVVKGGSSAPVSGSMQFMVNDFDARQADFKDPEGSSGFYSLGEKGSDAIEVWHGTTWDDTQNKVKETTFQEWVDECVSAMVA